MKSRNLKAIFASVLTVALLATAVTGFAANVTTTTTYNTVDGKVAVTTEVRNATGNSEVTYLVKSGNDIVYIDQETADESGSVDFVYKIAKEKMDGYDSTVTFGTDADYSFEGDISTLGIKALPVAEDETYTITYAGEAEAAGFNEKVEATIAAATGFEITEVKLNGISTEVSGNQTVEVGSDDEIKVTTQEVVVTPAIQYAYAKDVDGGYVTIIKVDGDPYEVGVVYKDNRYPSVTVDEYVAVKLILPDDVVAEDSDFQAYYRLDENADEVMTATPIQ